METDPRRRDPRVSLQSCAELVERGDPDRFLSVMAAPVAARPALFAIYAFNIEVTRAPWVTQESLIAEMRLQWWRDALEEIAATKPVRAHEVTQELARCVPASAAQRLDRVIEARRLDITREPFADWRSFQDYLRATSGELMAASAQTLGVNGDLETLADYGGAAGLANWLIGYPSLKAMLPEDGPDAIVAQAKWAQDVMKKTRAKLPKAAYPAVRASWLAARTLHLAAAEPVTIQDGTLHIPEVTRRGSLLWRVWAGRI